MPFPSDLTDPKPSTAGTPEPASTVAEPAAPSHGAGRSAADAPVIDARGGPPELVALLAAAMGEVEGVTKDARNKDQNYSYASIESMLRAVRLPLMSRGVLLLQHPRADLEREEPITSKSGTAGVRVLVGVDFEFLHAGDSFTIRGWIGEGQDYGDKAWSKARTNCLKTFIKAQWLLPTDEDTSAPPDRAPAHAAPALAVANAARRAAMLETLTVLCGGHEPTAVECGEKLAARFDGQMPDVVAAWFCTIPDWIKTGHERAATPPPPPPPTPGIGLSETGKERTDLLGDPIKAGSVEPPKLPDHPEQALQVLRAAGCICEQPLADPGEFSLECPIKGHGIAF